MILILPFIALRMLSDGRVTEGLAGLLNGSPVVLLHPTRKLLLTRKALAVNPGPGELEVFPEHTLACDWGQLLSLTQGEPIDPRRKDPSP